MIKSLILFLLAWFWVTIVIFYIKDRILRFILHFKYGNCFMIGCTIALILAIVFAAGYFINNGTSINDIDKTTIEEIIPVDEDNNNVNTDIQEDNYNP